LIRRERGKPSLAEAAAIPFKEKGLNRGEALAALAAAIAQNGFSALGRITAAEPVLPLAADFRRLILSFHV
jgi:hypothetical protein